MKKLFTLMASFVLTLSAMAQAYMVDPSKEITVSENDLDGVIGVLTNVEGTKVLSLGGGNSWDITSIDLSAWGSKYADYNYVLFEKADEDYGNLYKIRMAKSDKTFYSPSWANPAGDGCINFQPGAGVFVGGNKDQGGTDIDHGGVFIVKKTATGYEIMCQGKVAWLVPGIGQATTATSVKFYSALAVDLSASVETAYKAIPAGVQSDAVDAAYATAKATPTQANLDALKAAIAALDKTSLINNPQINGSTGWTCERPKGGNGPLLNNVSFEFWAGNASSRQDAAFDYYQVVNVPSGKYVLQAQMYNSSNGEGSGHEPNGNAGLYASSDNESFVGVTLDSDAFNQYYTTEVVTVKDGKLRIGVKSIGYMSARWFAADNFKLWYAGEVDLTELKEALEGIVKEANAILTGAMGQPYLTQEIVDAVNNSIDAAELSANPTAAEINEKIAALQAANEKNAAALETARKAYVLANPAEGEDLSFALNNTWTNASGTYGDCAERYVEAGVAAGKVMYSSVSGLVPGTYEVKFIAVANVARNLDNSVWAGEEKAYIYANDAEQAITIGTDASCTPANFVRTIQCYVGEDGVLEYGVLNKVDAGQWYVAKSIALTYVNDKKPVVDPVYTESISMSYETGVLTITPSNNDMYYAMSFAPAGATTAEAMKANFDMLLDGYYESAEDMEDAVEWGELFKGTSELDNETLAMFEVNAGDEVTFYAVGLVWDGAKAAYCTEVVEYTFTADATTAIKTVNTVANKNVMFNLAGQRVNNAKGIVIINGKKALVK